MSGKLPGRNRKPDRLLSHHGFQGLLLLNFRGVPEHGVFPLGRNCPVDTIVFGIFHRTGEGCIPNCIPLFRGVSPLGIYQLYNYSMSRGQA